jgi:hypothetical protein
VIVANSGLAALRYTLRRLALLILSAVIFYAVGMRGILMWAAAFLVSGAVALVWLKRDRDEMSAGIAGTISKVNQKFDKSNSKEDVD